MNMEKLFRVANRYCQESDWKTLAMIKCCLFSMGLLVGLAITKGKKLWEALATLGFLLTYVPLMQKLWYLWKKEN